MTDEPDEVLRKFEELCYWVNSAFARIMEIERKQPNYVAALLAAIGCEALSRLCGHKKEEQVFVEDLIPPGCPVDREMAADLFDVLRNGLAHTFDTNFIRLPDGTTIEIVVSWKEMPHLGLRPSEPPGIYMNCEQMRIDLEAVYGRYREKLRASSYPGRKLPPTWTRKRYKAANEEAIEGWRRFLEQ